MQAVAPHHLKIAIKHQPGRRIALADVIDLGAGRERHRLAAGETPGGLHQSGVEHRKHLVETLFVETHALLRPG